jgi:hypothetical protein
LTISPLQRTPRCAHGPSTPAAPRRTTPLAPSRFERFPAKSAQSVHVLEQASVSHRPPQRSPRRVAVRRNVRPPRQRASLLKRTPPPLPPAAFRPDARSASPTRSARLKRPSNWTRTRRRLRQASRASSWVYFWSDRSPLEPLLNLKNFTLISQGPCGGRPARGGAFRICSQISAAPFPYLA